MVVISRIHCGNVVCGGHGRILAVVFGADELMQFVHINARHITYAEQLGMELGSIREGQKGQPCIVTLKLDVVIPRRNHH